MFLNTPLSQDLEPDRTYPVLHVGVHEAPCASEAVQDPRLPLSMGIDASHGSGMSLAKYPCLYSEPRPAPPRSMPFQT